MGMGKEEIEIIDLSSSPEYPANRPPPSGQSLGKPKNWATAIHHATISNDESRRDAVALQDLIANTCKGFIAIEKAIVRERIEREEEEWSTRTTDKLNRIGYHLYSLFIAGELGPTEGSQWADSAAESWALSKFQEERKGFTIRSSLRKVEDQAKSITNAVEQLKSHIIGGDSIQQRALAKEKEAIAIRNSEIAREAERRKALNAVNKEIAKAKAEEATMARLVQMTSQPEGWGGSVNQMIQEEKEKVERRKSEDVTFNVTVIRETKTEHLPTQKDLGVVMEKINSLLKVTALTDVRVKHQVVDITTINAYERKLAVRGPPTDVDTKNDIATIIQNALTVANIKSRQIFITPEAEYAAIIRTAIPKTPLDFTIQQKDNPHLRLGPRYPIGIGPSATKIFSKSAEGYANMLSKGLKIGDKSWIAEPESHPPRVAPVWANKARTKGNAGSPRTPAATAAMFPPPPPRKCETCQGPWHPAFKCPGNLDKDGYTTVWL
ncbi:hypothetical protein DFH27DRAFT_625381 [Peziza echinospora]|nr:hypothetical protein DFH27DRAFT_625381 [Peziza echinospora]